MSIKQLLHRLLRGEQVADAARPRPGADQPTWHLARVPVPSWAQPGGDDTVRLSTKSPPITDPNGLASTDQYTLKDIQRVRGYRPGPRLSHERVVAKADENIAAYQNTHLGCHPAALVMSRFTHIFLCARAAYWQRQGHDYRVLEWKQARDGEVLCLSEQTLRWMFGERIGI